MSKVQIVPPQSNVHSPRHGIEELTRVQVELRGNEAVTRATGYYNEYTPTVDILPEFRHSEFEVVVARTSSTKYASIDFLGSTELTCLSIKIQECRHRI